MNIIVKRVFGNDVPEHHDVIRRRLMYLQDIDSIEESITDSNCTKLYLKSGEEILVKESFDALMERIEIIKEEEKRNDIIG